MQMRIYPSTLAAGLLALLPLFANAADKPAEPVDVVVTNPVVPVEISNSSPVPVSGVVTSADNPALSPVSLRAFFGFTNNNNQALLATVPAGKRLVIEHLSYYSGGTGTGQLVFLSLRNGEFGPVVTIAEINPPHAAATSNFTLQDGSQPAKAYFEAGEEVWLSASRSNSDPRTLDVFVVGHYVTL